MIPTKEQFLVALTKIEQLSPAPVILANALQLLRDPHSDIDSIASLVGRDSALVADIIRCANSAYYRGGNSSNIAEAVQKIGLQETMRLLNLAVARIVSGRDLDCYGISGADYWAESLFNGLFLQELARTTGAADPDEAYTVGLLRFIGRRAINQAIENLQGGIFWDSRECITQWEFDHVGLSQAEAGAMLLCNWRFSESMVQAIASQASPSMSPERSWLGAALHFATAILPQGIGTPFSPKPGSPSTPLPVGGDFMSHSGLTATGVDTLLRATNQAFDDVRKNLKV